MVYSVSNGDSPRLTHKEGSGDKHTNHENAFETTEMRQNLFWLNEVLGFTAFEGFGMDITGTFLLYIIQHHLYTQQPNILRKRPYLTLMPFGHGFCNGQAYTISAGLGITRLIGTIETVEKMSEIIGIKIVLYGIRYTEDDLIFLL